jgi:hypothetical protein
MRCQGHHTSSPQQGNLIIATQCPAIHPQVRHLLTIHFSPHRGSNIGQASHKVFDKSQTQSAPKTKNKDGPRSGTWTRLPLPRPSFAQKFPALRRIKQKKLSEHRLGLQAQKGRVLFCPPLSGKFLVPPQAAQKQGRLFFWVLFFWRRKRTSASAAGPRPGYQPETTQHRKLQK